ncbi:hypothetical protein SDC9_189004 [bioreactor metagenome]|uniref:Uncharacterized protein n=1 Tax=bioreactor metagenome TaxID=1076179 RepID=A0A645HQX9_9ZZZZ
MHQHTRDRGVNAAGQRTNHTAAANLFTHAGNQLFLQVCCAVIATKVTDLLQKVFKQLLTVLGMRHFRVELNSIKTSFFICKCRNGAGLCGSDCDKPFRCARYGIVMVHPYHIAHIIKQRVPHKANFGMPVFTNRRGGNLAAKHLREILHAITNAKHRYAKRKNGVVASLCALFIGAVRPAGKDDRAQRVALDALQRCVMRD